MMMIMIVMMMMIPSDNASTKLVVPDFATVPRLLIRSARVIPTPLSLIVNVLCSSLIDISISISISIRIIILLY